MPWPSSSPSWVVLLGAFVYDPKAVDKLLYARIAVEVRVEECYWQAGWWSALRGAAEAESNCKSSKGKVFFTSGLLTWATTSGNAAQMGSLGAVHIKREQLEGPVPYLQSAGGWWDPHGPAPSNSESE